jgi:hypothetical protein
MTTLNRPMFMNRGGLMRHDERTIRNVDDEIYRIAPRTHGTGAGRMDAREEYARDLREKAYLRNQMNGMAEGGPAMMPPMDPAMMAPPMPMDPAMMAPPPEVQVQMTENTAAQEGEMVGADYLDGMMTGLDAAEDTAEVIDAIRGNDKPLQARYDELASLVGEDDASATPESVLALVQPTLMMTEQGAVDSGIGELMQGIAGEVEMETEMGQGVGELMMAQSAPEVVQQMNAGGPVQYFARGTEVSRVQEIRDSADEFKQLYNENLGYTDEDAALTKMQIYLDMANRGLALAGGVNPNTGEEMQGSLFSQVAQAAQGAPQVYAQLGAQKRAADRAVSNASLGQAITAKTAQEAAEYAQALRNSDPVYYNVTDGEGNTDVVNANTAAGRTAIAGATTVTKVSAVTQPTQNTYRNVVVDGAVLGTINTSRGQDVDQNVADMIAQELPEVEADTTGYTLENVDTTGATESTEEQTLGTARANTLIDMMADGRAAGVLNRQYAVAKALTEEGDFRQGAEAGVRKYISEVNALFNNPIDLGPLFKGQDSAAAFESVTSNLIAQTVSGLQGFRATNPVMEMLRRAGPQLTNSAEGNLLLIEIAQAANDWKVLKGELAREHERVGGINAEIDGQTLYERIEQAGIDNPPVSEEIMQRMRIIDNNPLDTAALLNDVAESAEAANQSVDEYIDAMDDSWNKQRIRIARRYRQTMNADREAIFAGSITRGRPGDPPK